MQAIAEDMGRELRIPVIALSVDILFGPGADLADPSILEMWRGWCQEGIIAGFVAGPPCNTWCRARAHAESAGDGGPRVVRSVENRGELLTSPMRSFAGLGLRTSSCLQHSCLARS